MEAAHFSPFGKALGKAIVEHFESLLRDGKRPVGLQLMPAEVKVVRVYGQMPALETHVAKARTPSILVA
jgi:hypothetical protein